LVIPTILSGYPQVIPSLWTTRLPIFPALSSYDTIKTTLKNSLKLSDPYAKVGTTYEERNTMFTLHNPMKVMNERYVVTSHPCPMCGDTLTVSIASDKLFAYRQGGLAQNVLSEYDADVRERFISGICAMCWMFDEEFGEDV
jgi:predicted RNA-binding Zn-ribbon protein involved in translation (DUF1610 family)